MAGGRGLEVGVAGGRGLEVGVAWEADLHIWIHLLRRHLGCPQI